MVELSYVACVVCGKTVILNKFKGEPFRIPPLEFRVLQIREQKGGRSEQGFFNIPEKGRTIEQLWKGSEEERAIVECFKNRLLMVVRSYVKAGIIKPSELRVPTSRGSKP
jgi:hypothetical protein